MTISITTVIGAQSTANPLNKAFAAAVNTGDVLCAAVYVYNSTETCNGVSDNLNGAWTQDGGPVNAGNGTRIYSFYKLNSAAGTPTVTATFSSTNHHELAIWAISGLAGGGVRDQAVTPVAGLSTNPSVGPSAALGAAVCAAVGFQTNSGVTPSAYGAGWSLNANLNLGWQPTSYIQQITSVNSPITASWTQGNSYWNAGMMIFRDAGPTGPTFGVNATTAPVVGSQAFSVSPKLGVAANTAPVVGSMAFGPSSRLSVAANTAPVVGSISFTGNLVNGTFTSEPLRDYAGGLLANVALNYARLYNDTTGALVVSKTGLTTDATGVFSFTDASVTTGVVYRVDWETATGSRRMPRKAAA